MHPKARLTTIGAAQAMSKSTSWDITPKDVTQIVSGNANEPILYMAQKGETTIICRKTFNGEYHVKAVKW